MSFIKFKCQSLKGARFGTMADLDCYLEPRGFSCHSHISFLVFDIVNLKGLFIPLWLSTGNSLKSLGKAFEVLMVSKPERTHIQVF